MATASMGAGSGFPTDMLQLVDIEAAEVQRGVVACALYRHGRRERPTAAFEASLLLSAARQNDIVKRLGRWAAILAVPTAVGGI